MGSIAIAQDIVENAVFCDAVVLMMMMMMMMMMLLSVGAGQDSRGVSSCSC